MAESISTNTVASASPPSYVERSDEPCQPSPSSFRPWLGLKARLFLSLFSSSIVSLVILLVNLMTTHSQQQRQLMDAKQNFMDVCHIAEDEASSVLNLPYLFRDNFNQSIKQSIDDTIHGLSSALLLSISVCENVLIFLVDMYRSLYLCFIELLVRGTLSVITSVVGILSGLIHDVSQSIEATIKGSIQAINATLKASLGGINDILKIIGKSIHIVQVPEPDLSLLNNVTLPDTFDRALQNLNDTLPTLSDLKEKIDMLIKAPFEDMRSEIHTTLSSYDFNLDALPEMSAQNVSFCEDESISAPLDNASRVFSFIFYAGVGILCFIALLFVLFSLLIAYHQWKSLQRHVKSSQDLFDTKEKMDTLPHECNTYYRVMELFQVCESPLLCLKGHHLAKKLGVQSPEHLRRIRWWLSWISHPSCMIMLFTGFTGLMSTLLQVVLVQIILERNRDLFYLDWNNSLDGTYENLNTRMLQLSSDYANKSNVVINEIQQNINDGLLMWVNLTTSTINATLNEFTDGISEVLNSTFAETPLYTPIQSFIGCILGSKIAALEHGLNWIQAHAHVALPLVRNDILLVSNRMLEGRNQYAKLGDPLKLVKKLLDEILHALERQIFLFGMMILLYFTILSLGAIFAFLHGRNLICEMYKHWTRITKNKSDISSAGSTDSFAGFPQPIRTSHHSISAPLLSEVASLHYEKQRHEDELWFSSVLQNAHSTQLSAPVCNINGNCDAATGVELASQKPRSTFGLDAYVEEIPLHRTFTMASQIGEAL